jgi:hypothetical protein
MQVADDWVLTPSKYLPASTRKDDRDPYGQKIHLRRRTDMCKACWPELVAKQIELLQEAFPNRNRLGVLWDTQSAELFSAAESEAKARRLALHPFKLESPPYDFPAAFRTLAQADVQMLIVSSSPLFSPQSAQIA